MIFGRLADAFDLMSNQVKDEVTRCEILLKHYFHTNRAMLQQNVVPRDFTSRTCFCPGITQKILIDLLTSTRKFNTKQSVNLPKYHSSTMKMTINHAFMSQNANTFVKKQLQTVAGKKFLPANIIIIHTNNKSILYTFLRINVFFHMTFLVYWYFISRLYRNRSFFSTNKQLFVSQCEQI